MFRLRLDWQAIPFPFGITLIILGIAGILLLPGDGPLIIGILCVGLHLSVARWLRRRLLLSFHRSSHPLALALATHRPNSLDPTFPLA